IPRDLRAVRDFGTLGAEHVPTVFEALDLLRVAKRTKHTAPRPVLGAAVGRAGNLGEREWPASERLLDEGGKLLPRRCRPSDRLLLSRVRRFYLLDERQAELSPEAQPP